MNSDKSNITLRQDKFAALSHQEMDKNFIELKNVIDDVDDVKQSSVNKIELANPAGAANIGAQGGGTVQDKLDEIVSGAVTEPQIDAKIAEHSQSLEPHPELRQHVDQQAARAESEADRAEVAKEAAFVNADVYGDVASGLAATSDGEQFQVAEGAEVVRYRNESGSAVEVAIYPSSEFVNIALDVASQPGLVIGEFYADDKEQPIYSITDEDGNALSSWNQQGEMDANPSIRMAEKSQRARSEFHSSDEQPAFALTDEDGRPLYAVDENGQPIVPFVSEFHTENGQPAYAWTDKNGVVIHGIDAKGRVTTGGGIELEALPISPQGLADREAWLDRGTVVSSRSYSELFTVPHETLFPSHTDVYSYIDNLVAQFPDYLSKNVLGVDEWNNEIVEYVAMPPSNSPHTEAYSDSTIRPPKVLLIGSTHGDEWHAAIANIAMLEDMCKRWAEDDVLDSLRWGCELRLIPILVPSAWDAGSRRNANNVDINRNFPTDWGQGASGPEPLSENESQICAAWVNDHLDAVTLIDHHRNRNLNNDQFCWVAADRDDEIGFAMQHVQDMSAWVRRTFDFVPKDNRTLTIVTENFRGSISRHFSATTPIRCYLLESPRDITSALQPVTRRQIAYKSVKEFTRLIFDYERRKRQDNFSIQ